MSDARTEHNAAALKTLLPLLESHIDLHGRIVSRAQWVSPPDPRPPGWVPPPPEPDCEGVCWLCPDFRTVDCHLRQERWAQEWARMRLSYPILMQLEVEGGLLDQLTYEHLRWRLAIYREYVQPWSAWHPEKVHLVHGRIVSQREAWAAEGVRWLAKQAEGWLPVYAPKGMPEPENPKEAKRRWVADMIGQGFSQRRICREVGCSERMVVEVRKERKL